MVTITSRQFVTRNRLGPSGATHDNDNDNDDDNDNDNDNDAAPSFVNSSFRRSENENWTSENEIDR